MLFIYLFLVFIICTFQIGIRAGSYFGGQVEIFRTCPTGQVGIFAVVNPCTYSIPV